jgi:hypothetical protein
MKQFRLIQLVITLGLILSIAGGSSGSPTGGSYHVSTSSKVGIILYIVGLAACILVWLLCMRSISVVPHAERRLSAAVLLASPFIAVRLAYAFLSLFLHSHLFTPVDGSIVVLVCTATVEEFIVVFIYILLGWTLKKLEP